MFIQARDEREEAALLAERVAQAHAEGTPLQDMAVLTGASFDGADFKDAELHRTVIAGVDLSRAKGLTQDQVDDACGDARTRLPPRLEAHGCTNLHMIIHQAGPASWPAPPPPPGPPIPPGPRRLTVAPY